MKLTKLPGGITDLSYLIPSPATGELLASRQGPQVMLGLKLTAPARETSLTFTLPVGWRPSSGGSQLPSSYANFPVSHPTPYIWDTGVIRIGVGGALENVYIVWSYLTKDSPPPPGFLRKFLGATGRLVGWSK